MSALGEDAVKQQAHVGVRPARVTALETNQDLVAYFRQNRRCPGQRLHEAWSLVSDNSLQESSPPQSVPYRGFLLGGGIDHF